MYGVIISAYLFFGTDGTFFNSPIGKKPSPRKPILNFSSIYFVNKQLKGKTMAVPKLPDILNK